MKEHIPNGQGDMGKYDDECEKLAAETEADLVACLVVGGTRGSGFSVSTVNRTLIKDLPDLLENMAAQIRAQEQGQANS